MSLRYAVLGLLSVRSMSGYELKKVIDTSVRHFWTTDQSQVYRTLSALVEDGMAARTTVVQDDRPNLHPHAITEQGLSALDAWLASPLTSTPVRDTFLARLFFADRLPREKLHELLEARRGEVAEQLAALEAIEVEEAADEMATVLRSATLANGIRHARAELEWLEETRGRIDTAAR